jgi:AcrR family transcriptional regulator
MSPRYEDSQSASSHPYSFARTFGFVLDPREPVSLENHLLRSSVHAGSVRRHRYFETKSAILAASRRLLFRVDVNNLSIKDIAAESGISHQTIYNIIGRRRSVIEEAFCEWLSVLFNQANVRADCDNTSRVLAIIDSLFMAASAYPVFIGRFLVSRQKLDVQLADLFPRLVSSTLQEALTKLQRERALHDWINVQDLTRHLSLSLSYILTDMLECKDATNSFAEQFLNGPFLTICGAARRLELERIERTIHSHYPRWAHFPRIQLALLVANGIRDQTDAAVSS